ncbi:MAG: YigZ family protein [Lactobacillus sp.]|nr:YigZ family protein [Lactobacillus sp.]MCH3906598.1 YigZ family protein [Lactobacillus sp.]MCI1466926.1 YigZ family protein [Lactobacillus sp.]MCI1481744.1 YigZ family protein [Lactobacillus sp.]MCI1883258.1 YigZ family protein [Lactobacillus sp.]
MSKFQKYCTIKETGKHELIIKKSRFIASMSRCQTVTEAENFIELIKNTYRDATHNTFAYTLGLDGSKAKASDNGEPAGTAGVPELKALQLMDLHNVVVVVTRYFGGIKLGAGGLIRAYSNSVSAAAEAIGIVECIPQQSLTFSVPYPEYGTINHYLENAPVTIANRTFGAQVELTILVDNEAELIEQTKTELTNLLAGQIKFKQGTVTYREQTKTSK